MSTIITFYDIPTAEAKSWSPNTWRIRLALNYKSIPYQTVWVEFPDIAATCKKIGIPHSRINGDGSLFYTLPAIYDPSTGTALADSILIAQYLDETYPDTPKLFPTGSRVLQQTFIDSLSPKLAELRWFAIPATVKILSPASKEYFRATREKMLGKNIEDIEPTGTARDEAWAKVKAGLNEIDGWLQMDKANGPHIMGKDCVFVDFVVASALIYMKAVFGEESVQWRDIKTWNDGRWEAFVNRLEKYQAV